MIVADRLDKAGVLRQHVVGQEMAISGISRAIRRSRLGGADSPIGRYARLDG